MHLKYIWYKSHLIFPLLSNEWALYYTSNRAVNFSSFLGVPLLIWICLWTSSSWRFGHPPFANRWLSIPPKYALNVFRIACPAHAYMDACACAWLYACAYPPRKSNSHSYFRKSRFVRMRIEVSDYAHARSCPRAYFNSTLKSTNHLNRLK